MSHKLREEITGGKRKVEFEPVKCWTREEINGLKQKLTLASPFG